MKEKELNIFTVLQNKSRWFYVSLCALGGVSSLLFSGMLYIINSKITGEPLPYFPEYTWQVFALLIVLSIISNKALQTYMVKLTNSVLLDAQVSILEKLQYASYQSFERLGREKVYTAIQDASVLGSVPDVLVNTINSGVIILCCTIYFFWLAPLGGLLVLVSMGLLLGFYLLRNKKIERDLNKLRDIQNDFYRYLDDLLKGFREVKMSRTRNQTIFKKFLIHNRTWSKDLVEDTSIKYMHNELVGSYSWYVIIGICLFALPAVIDLSMPEIITLVVTIMYLIGPVGGMLGLVPFYTRAKIALNRLNRFETQLDKLVERDNHDSQPYTKLAAFDKLDFSGIQFTYPSNNYGPGFNVGPLDLTVNKGEVIFITGGNGSGKSTFINILTGLYSPDEGSIRIDGKDVGLKEYQGMGYEMSAIFTDNHLFTENYDGFEIEPSSHPLAAYLDIVQLREVVKIDKERGVIDPDMSKGQRKRLALVYTLMEDKQIIVMDEWAADQDPHFRKKFYTEILPYLKDKGKTVIAVTHDDNYYHCADRIIKFNFGRIVSDETIQRTETVR
ncbi:ATP-binding cassette domain-containing protein [Roseivirga sp. BDSF3-8]|uniref:ATP-binding cassette domain-containing protein n=1 Tax=Roseivirga sp. BDSF3-8 TaxID=3241598 RepID=UPI003531EC1A